MPFVVQPFLSLLTLDLSICLRNTALTRRDTFLCRGYRYTTPETFIPTIMGSWIFTFSPIRRYSCVMGSVTHGDNYSMDGFLENAGMIDLPLTAINYIQGYFIYKPEQKRLLTENDLYILTDQQGMYARTKPATSQSLYG